MMPAPPVETERIAARQTHLTRHWHQGNPAAGGTGLFRLVEENHLRNFLLWHEEDVARRDDLGFERVYRAKRNIDRFNQERNNFAEEIDQAIAAALNPPTSGCPRNSETPGMMIDRLSILALKEYHMQEETVRAEATVDHRERCAEKLRRIRLQRADLLRCLDELLADVVAGRRTFSVYFQFKMYNDPALNPQLYRPDTHHDGGKSGMPTRSRPINPAGPALLAAPKTAGHLAALSREFIK